MQNDDDLLALLEGDNGKRSNKSSNRTQTYREDDTPRRRNVGKQRAKQFVPLTKKNKTLLTLVMCANAVAIAVCFFLMVPEYRNMDVVQLLIGGVPALATTLGLWIVSNTSAEDSYD